jgi:hypothetical protein
LGTKEEEEEEEEEYKQENVSELTGYFFQA